MKSKLAENIRFLRFTNNLEQSELAKIIGVKQGQISAYERGVSTPKFDGILKLMDHFKITANDLISRDLAKEGTEHSKELSGVDNNHIIGMYQRELEKMREQIENDKDIPGLLDMLAKIYPEEIELFRKEHNI